MAAVTGADAAEPVVLSGQMIITEGAVFSDELSNSSSLLFKSLAFDIENLVRSHQKMHHASPTFIVEKERKQLKKQRVKIKK